MIVSISGRAIEVLDFTRHLDVHQGGSSPAAGGDDPARSLDAVQTLDASNNRIVSIRCVSVFRHLTTIVLAANGLTDDVFRRAMQTPLPEPHQDVSPVESLWPLSLQTMDVSFNSLQTLGSLLRSLRHVKDLTSIDASSNDLSQLGTANMGIEELSTARWPLTLTSLRLGGNRLQRLHGISLCPGLISLDVSDNLLDSAGAIFADDDDAAPSEAPQPAGSDGFLTLFHRLATIRVAGNHFVSESLGLPHVACLSRLVPRHVADLLTRLPTLSQIDGCVYRVDTASVSKAASESRYEDDGAAVVNPEGGAEEGEEEEATDDAMLSAEEGDLDNEHPLVIVERPDEAQERLATQLLLRAAKVAPIADSSPHSDSLASQHVEVAAIAPVAPPSDAERESHDAERESHVETVPSAVAARIQELVGAIKSARDRAEGYKQRSTQVECQVSQLRKEVASLTKSLKEKKAALEALRQRRQDTRQSLSKSAAAVQHAIGYPAHWDASQHMQAIRDARAHSDLADATRQRRAVRDSSRRRGEHAAHSRSNDTSLSQKPLNARHRDNLAAEGMTSLQPTTLHDFLRHTQRDSDVAAPRDVVGAAPLRPAAVAAEAASHALRVRRQEATCDDIQGLLLAELSELQTGGHRGSSDRVSERAQPAVLVPHSSPGKRSELNHLPETPKATPECTPRQKQSTISSPGSLPRTTGGIQTTAAAAASAVNSSASSIGSGRATTASAVPVPSSRVHHIGPDFELLPLDGARGANRGVYATGLDLPRPANFGEASFLSGRVSLSDTTTTASAWTGRLLENGAPEVAYQSSFGEFAGAKRRTTTRPRSFDQ